MTERPNNTAPLIGRNIVILTAEEYQQQLNVEFHRGVARGRFEERLDAAKAKRKPVGAHHETTAIPTPISVDGPARECRQGTTRVAPSAVGAGSGHPDTTIPPDNGTLSRRIRRWNIRNGFVLTYLFWFWLICLAAPFVFQIARHVL